MLSGLKDEIIPYDHMRRLWEVVAKRGEKKKLNGSEYKTGLERAKYIEFVNGHHSTLNFISLFLFLFCFLDFRLCFNLLFDAPDDTCAQPGYWVAVADFMISLIRATQEKSQPF